MTLYARCTDMPGLYDVSCDRCGVVAAPGPKSRGGHDADWLVKGNAPPGWSIANSDMSTKSEHYCVTCTRGRKGKP